MAASPEDRSCSVCGRALQSGDEWISLDGGETWCADCWQQRFSGQPKATGKPPPEPREKDLELLAEGEVTGASPGPDSLRPCMNCGHLCPPGVSLCPDCGGQLAPPLTQAERALSKMGRTPRHTSAPQATPQGGAAREPALPSAAPSSAAPFVSLGQGQPFSASGGTGAPVVHQINIGQSGGQTGAAPAKTSGLAVASLVLSLVGLLLCPLLIPQLLALIFGGAAMRNTSKEPALGGHGMAVAGFIMGIIGVALWVFWLVVTLEERERFRWF